MTSDGRLAGWLIDRLLLLLFSSLWKISWKANHSSLLPTAVATCRPVRVVSASTGSIQVVVVWPVVSTTTEPTSTSTTPVSSVRLVCDSKSIPRSPTIPYDPLVYMSAYMSVYESVPMSVFALTSSRSFHKQQNHFWKPVINIDKVRSIFRFTLLTGRHTRSLHTPPYPIVPWPHQCNAINSARALSATNVMIITS